MVDDKVMKVESKVNMLVNISEGQEINIVSADKKKQIITWTILALIVSFLLWFNNLKEKNEIDDLTTNSQQVQLIDSEENTAVQ